MNPEDRCALPAHRGAGPENGIAFSDLSRVGNSLGNFESSRVHEAENSREFPSVPYFTLRCFVRSKVALIDRDRVMDSVKRVNRE